MAPDGRGDGDDPAPGAGSDGGAAAADGGRTGTGGAGPSGSGAGNGTTRATDDASTPGYALGLRSVDREYEGRELPVEGSLPDWLSGAFYRNGPGRFEAGGREIAHWFDGLAMLRRFGIDGATDRVTYTNRFLRTDAYGAAMRGETVGAGFAATPDRGLLDRVRSLLDLDPTDNANADVARLGDRLVAVTESPNVVAVDPRTLETRGVLDWDDDLPVGHTTPHYRRDPDRGETWGYLTSFLPRPAYHLFRVPDGTTRRKRVARIPVRRPAYMHSFGLTDSFAVLVEPPLTVSPVELFAPTGDPFIERYEWQPQRRTRVHVVDRDTGDVVARRGVRPFFTFHVANAFEDDGAVVFDAVAWDTPRVLRGMYLDRMDPGHGADSGGAGTGPGDAGADGTGPGDTGDDGDGDTGHVDADTDDGGGELRRYRVPLSGGAVTRRTVHDGLGLPRTPGRPGRRHRYVYGQDAAGGSPPRAVARVDVDRERVVRHRDPGYVSEPVFVARPRARADEGAADAGDGGVADADGAGGPDLPAGADGAVLFTSLVPRRGRSELVVLDAADLTELARAPLPHPLPFGFHGQFYRDAGPGAGDGPT